MLKSLWIEQASNVLDDEKRQELLDAVAWPEETGDRVSVVDERKMAASLARVGAQVDFEAFARRRAVAQARKDAAAAEADRPE